MSKTSEMLMAIYRVAYERFGHQRWWPGETQLEICVGAILTQNTNWTNVEKALANLKAAGVMSIAALHEKPTVELAELIRPAGYFNVKARRLKNFVERVHEYGSQATGNRHRTTAEKTGEGRVFRDAGVPPASREGILPSHQPCNTAAGTAAGRAGETPATLPKPATDPALAAFLDRPVPALREDLLSISGVGRETADSMILYAAGKCAFVVDAYTCRILLRHYVISPEDDYEAIKDLLESSLPADVDLYNDFHAQFVAVGKNYCKPTARCEGCPLEKLPHDRHLGSRQVEQ